MGNETQQHPKSTVLLLLICVFVNKNANAAAHKRHHLFLFAPTATFKSALSEVIQMEHCSIID